MQEKTVKRYYLVSGVLFALAIVMGIIRLFDIVLQKYSLSFLDIPAIILLILSLIVMVVMIVHSVLIEKKQNKEAQLRANDSEKLKKYVSKKNK